MVLEQREQAIPRAMAVSFVHFADRDDQPLSRDRLHTPTLLPGAIQGNTWPYHKADPAQALRAFAQAAQPLRMLDIAAHRGNPTGATKFRWRWSPP
jgi:hypothetical protein